MDEKESDNRKLKVVENIRENYQSLEGMISKQLFMGNELHGPTTGSFREEIWAGLFGQILPKKFVIEQSAFIIDSEEGISKEIDLKCSGVCIFSTDLEERQIKESLRKIFEFYYREYDGKLFIKYLCFETEVASDTDKLQVIRKCKKRLKSKSCLNEVIRENRQAL